MKKIKLSQGKVTLVDYEDYEYLNQWKWYTQKVKNTFYAIRTDRTTGKAKTIRIHQVIMKTPIGMEVDHKDGNGLNNQKYNLRNCTKHQNSMNKKLYENTSSKYKGVSYYPRYQKWVAYITLNRKRIFLGYFSKETEAFDCRRSKAKELFGEFAPKH
jgi:hypothetical protein